MDRGLGRDDDASIRRMRPTLGTDSYSPTQTVVCKKEDYTLGLSKRQVVDSVLHRLRINGTVYAPTDDHL